MSEMTTNKDAPRPQWWVSGAPANVKLVEPTSISPRRATQLIERLTKVFVELDGMTQISAEDYAVPQGQIGAFHQFLQAAQSLKINIFDPKNIEAAKCVEEFCDLFASPSVV